MLSHLRRKLTNERGATSVEYSVMVVLIAAVIVLSVSFLGGTTSSGIDCAGKSWQNKTSQCAAGGSSGGSTVSPSPTTGGTTTGGTTGTSTGGTTNGNGGVGQGNGQGNAKH